MIGEEAFALQGVEHANEFFCGFGMRGQLFLQLGPAVIPPGE